MKVIIVISILGGILVGFAQPETHEDHSLIIKNHYVLAGFGWLLYMVGKLWYFRNEYDTNNDGLGLAEVGSYFRKNWIVGLFNGMLIVVAVPFAPQFWNWGTGLFDVSKDWEFTDLVYILAGGFILVIQIIVDWVRSKKK